MAPILTRRPFPLISRYTHVCQVERLEPEATIDPFFPRSAHKEEYKHAEEELLQSTSPPPISIPTHNLSIEVVSLLPSSFLLSGGNVLPGLLRDGYAQIDDCTGNLQKHRWLIRLQG